MDENTTQKRRWPRSQQFTLSPLGTEAEASYRSTIVASRTESGRASFDAARMAWATSFRVEPDDGIYLGEVAAGPMRLEKIVAALEACGKTRKDAQAAIERLFDAGLMSTT